MATRKTTCQACFDLPSNDQGKPVNDGTPVQLCLLTQPKVEKRIQKKVDKRIEIDEDMCPDCHHLVSVHVATNDDAMQWPPPPVGVQNQAQVVTRQEFQDLQSQVKKLKLDEYKPRGSVTEAEFFEQVAAKYPTGIPLLDDLRFTTDDQHRAEAILQEESGWGVKTKTFAKESGCQTFLNRLFAKLMDYTEVDYIDTHGNVYLTGLKPDGSFISKKVPVPHQSTVNNVAEYKKARTRDDLKHDGNPMGFVTDSSYEFSHSNLGRAFTYSLRVLDSQKWRGRTSASTILCTPFHVVVVRVSIQDGQEQYQLSRTMVLKNAGTLAILRRLLVDEHVPSITFFFQKKEYVVMEILGSGSHAYIYGCQPTEDASGPPLTVKAMRSKAAAVRELTLLQRLQECRYLPHVQDEMITLSIAGEEWYGFMMVERLQKPDISKKGYGMTREDVVDYARALFSLHKSDFVHRDVHPRNLLFYHPDDIDGDVAAASVGFLIDFGSAIRAHEPSVYAGTRTTASDAVLRACAADQGNVSVEFHDDLISLYRSVYLYTQNRAVPYERLTWATDICKFWAEEGAPIPSVPTTPDVGTYEEFGNAIAKALALPRRKLERFSGLEGTSTGSPAGCPVKEELKVDPPLASSGSTPSKPRARRSRVNVAGNSF